MVVMAKDMRMARRMVAALLLAGLALAGASRAALRPSRIAAHRARARLLAVDSGERACTAVPIDFLQLAAEYNERHASDVVSIALQRSAIDFTQQELTAVKIASLDETGLLLEEVVCDLASDTCIALTVPVAFARRCESEEALRAELAEMALLRDDAPQPAALVSQTSCAGLLETVNRQFGHSLELFVLRQGGVVLSEEDVLERCRAVDLDGTGFTLETIVCHDDGESCDVSERRVLFNRSCSSVEEIEDALCRLLLVSD